MDTVFFGEDAHNFFSRAEMEPIRNTKKPAITQSGAVTVLKELGLVVKKLLTGLSGELKVETLHNSVDRGRLLAE
jgi:hypothetical protein